LLRSIDRYLARDANFLLNVGPTSDGCFPDEANRILARIGRWIDRTRESFSHTVPVSHLTTNRSVLLTCTDRDLYVHLCDEPLTHGVDLKPIQKLPVRATLLNTGQSVSFSNEMTPSDHETQLGFLRLHDLPVNELSNTVMVIKLEFDRPLFPGTTQSSLFSAGESQPHDSVSQ
jgi:alpha-L-fucosidase